MSPVATGGSPHTQTTVSNGGGPVPVLNGVPSSDILKKPVRKLPHLDDLLGARPDVDINTPFKTILQKGEELSRQADTHLDFRRPEIALQDYVKAAIIAVEILPKHKDFSALQDRPEWNRLYLGLSKRISAQHGKFTAVKETIKENNRVHGVKPTVEVISTGTRTLRLENVDNSHGRARSDQSAISPGKKVPPPVQPKPDALHGQAIHPTSNGTMAADLATRFARLRSPDLSPQVQDPRIRTQPIYTNSVRPSSARTLTSTSRPTGPREMPSVPISSIQPRINVDVNIPGMPKAPDAIYSPDRGDESTALSSLRSSASLANVRKYSAPPISTVGPSPLLLDGRRDYFALTSAISAPSANSLKRKEPSIPDSATISPEDLMKYTGSDAQSLRVLLVDLRSREDFDSGHIMSQSIICVEPITLRHGISGEELENTMVVAPDNEQELYERRQDFDLVVVYDQDSNSLGPSRSESSTKLQDFMSAVYDYGYDKQLKRRPAVLVGGLDGWIDLLGPNALQASKSSNTAKTRGKSNTPLARAFALRNSYHNDISKRRISRQLSSQEQTLWETKLSAESGESENDVSEEFSYAKTTEDFFRRYPEVHTLQQSMVSSSTLLTLQQQQLDDALRAMSPRPPTRPAPALPRQRSSGINGPRMISNPAHTVESITNTNGSNGLTGLQNKYNTCYMNAALQAISATHKIRNQLKDFTFPANPPVPKKAGELGNQCPQLMVRCFGNLLGHLWQGTYDYVVPTTFLEYVRSVDSPNKAPADRYAMGRQQDAGEFYMWLMTLLEDETNNNRGLTPVVGKVTQEELAQMPPPTPPVARLVDACKEAKDYMFRFQQSEISQLTNYTNMRQSRCTACLKIDRSWNIDTVFQCMINDYKALKAADITSWFKASFGSGGKRTRPQEFNCPGCGRESTTEQMDFISHFPEILVLNIGRYIGMEVAGDKATDVTPFHPEMDITDCQVVLPEEEKSDRADKPPFNYKLYAIVRHQGTRTGGHYTAYTRHLDIKPRPGSTAPSAGNWNYYDDDRVRSALETEVFSNVNYKEATILFYQRSPKTPKP